ncbi:MAG: hypothetical protein WC466_10575 [Candidatus Izemoplasmatales bacterium]
MKEFFISTEKEFDDFNSKNLNIIDFPFNDILNSKGELVEKGLACSVSKNLKMNDDCFKTLLALSEFKKIIPFTCSSFYRSEKHPLHDEKHPSQHFFTRAMDCRPAIKTMPFYIQFAKYAYEFYEKQDVKAFGGIGVYSTHVHLDTYKERTTPYWLGVINEIVKGGLVYRYIYFKNFNKMIESLEIMIKEGDWQ